MATRTPTEMQLTVPARTAAIGWINAFLATSQDENRPMLYRTISLEFFDTGIQIVCTDGTALFRTWVPETEGDAWPGVSVKPEASVVVMDPDAFGIGFMRALLRVTSDEVHQHEALTVSTAPADDEATIALGAEFMTERLTLRACGQRIDLRLYDGLYPKWRGLHLGLEQIEYVEGMTVAPRIFALVGKLKGVSSVDLTFHGEARRVDFVARGDTQVRGLLMPMRRLPPTPTEKE